MEDEKFRCVNCKKKIDIDNDDEFEFDWDGDIWCISCAATPTKHSVD